MIKNTDMNLPIGSLQSWYSLLWEPQSSLLAIIMMYSVRPALDIIQKLRVFSSVSRSGSGWGNYWFHLKKVYIRKTNVMG
jgi:hypothetical protein